MNFYVYENWRAKGHRAMIHRFDCPYCNDGKGFAGGTRADNGKWLGPYKDLNSAEISAEKTGGRVEYCSRCMRDE